MAWHAFRLVFQSNIEEVSLISFRKIPPKGIFDSDQQSACTEPTKVLNCIKSVLIQTYFFQLTFKIDLLFFMVST